MCFPMQSLVLALGFLAICSVQPVRAGADDWDVDSAARYLAGMTADNRAGFKDNRASREWNAYARDFAQRWTKLNDGPLSAARAFAATHIRSKHAVAYYMFSGPDFPFANAFFPNAAVYVLNGLEPAADPGQLQAFIRSRQSLIRLRASLGSYFKLGFFKTDEMKREQEFAGITPLLMALLVRSGNRLKSIEAFQLENDGQLNYREATPIQPDGLKVAFVDSRSRSRLLYYFAVDLANEGAKSAAFLRFCRNTGPGDSLLKSASYLLHDDRFSDLRESLINRSRFLVQDDSGIPIRYLNRTDWTLQLFAKYQPPIGQFEKYFQPELASLPQPGKFKAYSFDTGYLGQVGGSHFLLVKRRATP